MIEDADNAILSHAFRSKLACSAGFPKIRFVPRNRGETAIGAKTAAAFSTCAAAEASKGFTQRRRQARTLGRLCLRVDGSGCGVRRLAGPRHSMALDWSLPTQEAKASSCSMTSLTHSGPQAPIRSRRRFRNSFPRRNEQRSTTQTPKRPFLHAAERRPRRTYDSINWPRTKYRVQYLVRPKIRRSSNDFLYFPTYPAHGCQSRSGRQSSPIQSRY